MDNNSPQSLSSPDDSFVKVRRGRVASVDLYEIKDSELDTLEQGSPATLQLNFAIFLFSTAFTSIGALSTATFTSNIVKYSFLFVSIIGIIMGAYLFISWWNNKKSVKITIKRIRGRIALATAPPHEVPDITDNNSHNTQDDSPK